MTTPTWGLRATGYSYPSARATAYFNKLYPYAAADHAQAVAVAQAEQQKKQKALILAEQKVVANCLHEYAPTNVGAAVICLKCKHHLPRKIE